MNFIEIGTDIKKKFPEISSVLFVGCIHGGALSRQISDRA